jgi:hypothetical protein
MRLDGAPACGLTCERRLSCPDFLLAPTPPLAYAFGLCCCEGEPSSSTQTSSDQLVIRAW